MKTGSLKLWHFGIAIGSELLGGRRILYQSICFRQSGEGCNDKFNIFFLFFFFCSSVLEHSEKPEHIRISTVTLLKH